jgi:hypothetical protein
MAQLICQICEKEILEDTKYGYVEDGVLRKTCRECHQAGMQIKLDQILRRRARKDFRLVLRGELGLEGKFPTEDQKRRLTK